MLRPMTCAVLLASVLATAAALLPSVVASKQAPNAAWMPVVMVGVSASKASGMVATAAHCVPDTGDVHLATMTQTCQVAEAVEGLGPVVFRNTTDLASYPAGPRAAPQTPRPCACPSRSSATGVTSVASTPVRFVRSERHTGSSLSVTTRLTRPCGTPTREDACRRTDHAVAGQGLPSSSTATRSASSPTVKDVAQASPRSPGCRCRRPTEEALASSRHRGWCAQPESVVLVLG